MSNTSRSKAMKLRKSHAGWGIFMFILIFLMASVILALIASMLITFSVNSKALSEADAVNYMAKLYNLTDEKNICDIRILDKIGIRFSKPKIVIQIHIIADFRICNLIIGISRNATKFPVQETVSGCRK